MLLALSGKKKFRESISYLFFFIAISVRVLHRVIVVAFPTSLLTWIALHVVQPRIQIRLFVMDRAARRFI